MECVRLPSEAGSVTPSTVRPEFLPSRRCPAVSSKGGSSDVLSFVPWALLGGCGRARLKRSRRGICGVLRARQAEIFQVPLDGDEVSDPRTFSSKIAVAELEGKGCGVVATRAISRGEVVLKESPLLGLPVSFESASDAEALLNATSLRQLDEDLNSALTSCSQASQDRFWELSDCHGEPKTAAGIALTNALQLGKGGGLLAMSARFNHSCKPNVQGGWDKSQGGGMAVWHALRDISAGEELCFSYVDPYETEAERQSTLQSLFKFQCRWDWSPSSSGLHKTCAGFLL